MNCGRLINPHFVGVVCFIVFNYFVFVYEYMISLKPGPYIVLLVVFNLLFVLLLVSMGKAILGDPGRVPIYWGFFAEESENRKRRYCLLCHSFKPERQLSPDSGATTARPASGACSTWTTTVPGSPTAWASPTASSSCSSSSTSSSPSSSPSPASTRSSSTKSSASSRPPRPSPSTSSSAPSASSSRPPSSWSSPCSSSSTSSSSSPTPPRSTTSSASATPTPAPTSTTSVPTRTSSRFSAPTPVCGSSPWRPPTRTGPTEWSGPRTSDRSEPDAIFGDSFFCAGTGGRRVDNAMIMSGPKEPSVKLIPSDPMTNTILIIYCVSSTGASVPYKSIWRKINPKKNRVEEIKTHNGTSYRCSPLDIDCIIEATVIFQHQNMQMQRVVQSNLVKVSRELKERKMYMKEPIPCRVTIDELPIEVKVFVQEGNLLVLPTNVSYQQATFSISLHDIIPEAESNQHMFRVYFKLKFEDFLNYFAQLLGWKPQIKSQYFTFFFNSDINRDIVLLGIAEVFQRTPDHLPKHPMQFPMNLCAVEERTEANMLELMREGEENDNPGHIKNRSQTSLSPANSNREKIKVNEKMQLKKSFTNTNKDKDKEKKLDTSQNYASPLGKAAGKERPKDREYLNVFEEDDFLDTAPASAILVKSPETPTPITPIPNPKDQPSINLRGSFEQLQRSFSSNVNEQTLEKVFGDGNQSRKYIEEIEKLKKENEQLRKQAESVNSLLKENNSIKKKYHELKEEINRLEMERKVILTDKLRCEVNWHKEIQEKEFLKKEVDHLREMLKNGSSAPSERTLKSNSIHEVARNDNRERNRSPNSSFYNR